MIIVKKSVVMQIFSLYNNKCLGGKMKINLEIENLSEFACPYKVAERIQMEGSDIRPEFTRDIDRIIHTLSYTRYIDKTQVFTYTDNDNVTKRIIHVQLVSKIARTIGRALKLNEDLIEAASLGHDLGHCPFGHVGEKYLNELSLKYDNSLFAHNVQSVRTLMTLENNGKGKNITYQVLDAILCHNGEFLSAKYYPKKKTKEEFLKEYKQCYLDKETLKKLRPATLEGCIVRISDIIGYLGRDIEDAIMLGLITKEDIPKKITKILGNSNREIINNVILDIIKNSYNKNYIALSDEVFKALIELKNFNYEYIYNKANNQETLDNIKDMINLVFKTYLNDLEKENKDSNIYQIFLNNMSDKYLNSVNNVRKVIDYIAGMTDNFFIAEYNKLIKLK